MKRDRTEIVGLIYDLCEGIRDAVRPMMGSASARGIGKKGATGDVTFSIDEVAEETAAEILDSSGDIAYYTEDRGLTVRGEPDILLVIDPIDGTRPAVAGLEACCVSVAAAPLYSGKAEELTLGDVFLGIVSELKNSAVFTAVRGEGVEVKVSGRRVPAMLSTETRLNRIFWTSGFRGRPAEPLTTVIGELVDSSSVDGGCFDLGSAAFCITRIVTGEMDAYVDVGQRMVEEVESVREIFLKVGHGAILNNYPYDLAAAILIASEAGAVTSDAYGKPLEGYPLVPSGGGGQLSSLVSSNMRLHDSLVGTVDRGMDRLRVRYGST